MNLTRRSLLGLAAAAPLAMAAPAPAVKLGIDLFSLRSQNWTPFQLLDYSAKLAAKVVHFSEIRFIGNLEPENLRAVRRYAEERGIEIEIGMKSICPTSKMFDAKAGTAEEQIGRMLDSATLAGSRIVRAVLGSSEDRRPGPIEKHIESTVKVLRNVRSLALDHNLKIAIENHSGDMQAPELKQLIEESGKDFVGACLDSGNPLWTRARLCRVARAGGRGGIVGAHGARQRGHRRVLPQVRGALPRTRTLAGIHHHQSANFRFPRSSVLGGVS
jgi:sugar phosphate isomerase/epimerase